MDKPLSPSGHRPVARARILLITSNSSERGGGERLLVYLTQGLQDAGCETHVLIGSQPYMDGWARAHADAGGRLHRLRLRSLRERPLRFLQSITDRVQHVRIANFCRGLRPDAILISQQYDEDGLDYIVGALEAAIAPVAGLVHMPMTLHKDRRPFGRWRGRLLSRWYRAHHYLPVFTSRGSRGDFEKYYAWPRPTCLAHAGVPLASSTIGRPTLPPAWADGHVPVVGFAGQFVPQKHLTLLADAWLESRRVVDSRLLLVGDGPERATVVARLQNRVPPDRWHVTGWTDEPGAYISAMDLFAMTSHFEGLPLVLLEAAGRGVPALVTDFNGAADVADRAGWVSVTADATPSGLGYALSNRLTGLAELKRQAIDGQAAFRAYFSPRRMAGDILAGLAVG